MGGSVEDAFALLQQGVDAVAAIDPDHLGATALGQVLETLEARSRQLDCTNHQLLRRFDARGDHTVLGYKSVAQWQRDRLGVSGATASARAWLARRLASMPTVENYWAAGEISTDKVRLVSSANTAATADAFIEHEEWLADQTVVFDYHDLTAVIRAWKVRANPDESDPLVEDRAAHVSTTLGGAVVVDGVLDAIGGATFKVEFERIVELLFQAEWAEAKERLGREPCVDELARTPRQRRADALVEMAVRSAAADVTDENRPRPLFTVVLDPERFGEGLAELWNGHPLTARQLADLLADDPDIERFVYGGPAQPIRHNPRRRFFTGRLRRAIEVRDRHCTGRGCHVSASRCQVDHITPVSEGGETTCANGRLACGPCNRARPNRRFTDDPDPP